MAAQDVDDEIQKLMRPKSTASSMGIPVKTLLDWKIEQRFKDDEMGDDRVGILNSKHTTRKIHLLINLVGYMFQL